MKPIAGSALVLWRVEGIGDAEVALHSRHQLHQALGRRRAIARSRRYPDSTAMTACTKSGSTPCRRPAESTMPANDR